jgi:hypothetical protein
MGNGLMTRLKASDLFFSRLPFIDEIMYENFDAPALTYTQVFDVRSSERAYEETTGYSGFGLFSEKDQDGGVVDYDTILQLFDKRFIHTTYAKAFQISEEAQADDIDGVINNAAPALGRAAQTSIETVIWNVFNNGFGTETTPDGKSLFSSTHVFGDGGSFSNIVSGDLANSTLESAITKFDTMTDDRGLPIQLSPAVLVYPSQLRFQASVVLQSQLRPGTTNNDINALNRLGLREVMSKYLTDDDNWFVGAPANVSKLIVYWREEPRTDHMLDFETGNMKTKMTYRFSTGAADWKGWVGGQGV